MISSYLLKNDIRHKVLDNDHYAAATHAAAGLVNPITGRGYVKSWMIDELIPEAHTQYAFLEDLLSMSLVYKSVILRTLRTPEQVNKWTESTAREAYEDYLLDHIDDNDYESVIHPPMKYGIIAKAFRVEISQLIKKYRLFLADQDMLINEKFDFSQLKQVDGQLLYQGQTYSCVIFCEGHQAIENPFFSGLPFQLAKGEALTIELDSCNPKQILRDEIFMVPQGENQFWSGGSYIWNFEDHLPTEDWKNMWVETLNSMLKKHYRITNHKAGVRPAVKGRRPLIGRHKSNNQIMIFNGLGTKGTSLGPFWARHFVEDHILGNLPIDERVDINRFEY